MTDDLTEDDKALFQNQMKGVKPLTQGAEKTQRYQSTPKPIRRQPREISFHKTKPYFLSDFIQEEVLTETTLSYRCKSVSNQRFRQLRLAEIRWESRLDLHGLKSDNAREVLSQFIQSQYEQNQRCLLIIHGKGGHEGAPPIIKNLVNRWLPQFEEVMAFHSALPKDGGQGAVYVLLKKNRNY